MLRNGSSAGTHCRSAAQASRCTPTENADDADQRRWKSAILLRNLRDLRFLRLLLDLRQRLNGEWLLGAGRRDCPRSHSGTPNAHENSLSFLPVALRITKRPSLD